jgi:transposase
VVRMVRTLRAELGTEQRTVQRVARQLEFGIESVRQADIDDGLRIRRQHLGVCADQGP